MRRHYRVPDLLFDLDLSAGRLYRMSETKEQRVRYLPDSFYCSTDIGLRRRMVLQQGYIFFSYAFLGIGPKTVTRAKNSRRFCLKDTPHSVFLK